MSKDKAQKIKRRVVINGLGGRKVVEEYDPKKHGEAPAGVQNRRREKALAEARGETFEPTSGKKKKD
jgi:hypothetical protein